MNGNFQIMLIINMLDEYCEYLLLYVTSRGKAQAEQSLGPDNISLVTLELESPKQQNNLSAS